MPKVNSSKRLEIVKFLETEGPADLNAIHARFGGSRTGVFQFLKRMEKDGWLTTFKHSSKTYITSDITKLQRSPNADQ